MNRITDIDLKNLVHRINDVTKSPKTYSSDGKTNVGYFHVSYEYGGVSLQRTVNEGGGVELPLGYGIWKKRELYDLMQAFYAGLSLQPINQGGSHAPS